MDPTAEDSGSSQLPRPSQGSQVEYGASSIDSRDISTQSLPHPEASRQLDSIQSLNEIDNSEVDLQASQSSQPAALQSQKFYQDEGLIPVDTPSPVIFGRPPSARPSTVDEDERQIRSNFQNLLKPRVFMPPEEDDIDDLPPIGPLTLKQFEEAEMQFVPQMRYYMPRSTTTSSDRSSGSAGKSSNPINVEARMSARSNQAEYFDGLIPVDEPEVPSVPHAPPTSPLDEAEISLRSHFEILLERQRFEAPAPRWVSPPNVVRLLQEVEERERRVEDGLEVAGIEYTSRQSHPFRNPATCNEDDINVQRNLERLLSRPDFAPPDRWNAPVSSIQIEMDFQGRIPLAHGFSGFDDGLIAVEGQTPSPAGRRSALSTTDDGSQVRINLGNLLRQSMSVQPPESLNISIDEDESVSRVNCTLMTMSRPGDDRELQYKTQAFSPKTAPLFSQWVSFETRESIGLIFLVITDWSREFRKPFHSTFLDFPIQTLLCFDTPDVASMLPAIDYNEGELSWTMEHINIKPAVNYDDGQREIDLGYSSKAQCLPLAVWTRAQGALRDQADRPVIVVITRCARTIQEDIIQHYQQEQYKRWDRLRVNQAWVYLDLYFLFTRWDQIWALVKRNLNERIEEIHGRRSVVPIQHQTRQLHRDNMAMINLREHVRIHKTSVKIVMQRVENMLGGSQWIDTQHLKTRLEDAYQAIEFFDVTATTLLEQQQNLLSLAFNLETVANGQAVARLNALAFIFLPLSFVASLFGITTWEVGPAWYPVVAVPVLAATILAAYAANKLFNDDEPRIEQDHSLLETDGEKRMLSRHRPLSHITKILTMFPSVLQRSHTNNKSTGMPRRPGFGVRKKSGNSVQEIQEYALMDPSRPIRNPAPLYDLEFSHIAFGNDIVLPRSTVQFVPSAYGDPTAPDMARLIPRYGYDGNTNQRASSSRGNASTLGREGLSSQAIRPSSGGLNPNIQSFGRDPGRSTGFDNTDRRASVAGENPQEHSSVHAHENQVQSHFMTHQSSEPREHVHLSTQLQMQYDVSYAFGGNDGGGNAVTEHDTYGNRNIVAPIIPSAPPSLSNGSASVPATTLSAATISGSMASPDRFEMSSTPPSLQKTKSEQHPRTHTPEARRPPSNAGLDTISEETGRENRTSIVE
ncbi:hypothetical protein F5884DRAFT_849257 [Xylogone sp. PMI_703]|nr:hypothetical protein F5884DRAFT_849257 [Xylogone sp. PMI_703]